MKEIQTRVGEGLKHILLHEKQMYFLIFNQDIMICLI